MHDQQRRHQHGGHQPIELFFVERMAEQHGLVELDAHRSFGEEGHLVDQNLDDGAEGQRHHGQIRPRHAQRRQSERHAEGGRHHDGCRQREPDRRRKLEHQHARGIGADAEQARMAERDLACVADHHIEPEQQNGVDEDGADQMDVIRVARQQRKGRERDQPEQHGDILGNGHEAQTFLIAVLPNNPAGRVASTSSNKTRPGTSL